MSDMRKLINLIESVQAEPLLEAPIDDFSKNPDTYPPNDSTIAPAVFGMTAGTLLPIIMFMNVGFLAQLGGSIGGFIIGSILGSLASDFEDSNEYAKKRKQLAKQMANTPINTEIRSDVRSFMNNMIKNIPDNIQKYDIELKNIDKGGNSGPYDEFQASWEHPGEGNDASDLHKRTEVIADLLKDYLKKQNNIFDQLAKKHNITPLQLGAIAHLLYGENIENAFVERLQSKLTDPKK